MARTRRVSVGPPLDCTEIGWDMDGVLASNVHRKYLIPLIRDGRESWQHYHLRCLDDEPIEGACALMRLMSDLNPRVRHVVMSYRDEVALRLTCEWCHRNDLPVSRFMLKPAHFPEAASALWKVQCIRQRRSEGAHVALYIEDWLEDAKVITEMTGVPVLRATQVLFGPPPDEQPWASPDADIMGDLRAIGEKPPWPTRS
jgi:hypothetical protein